MTKQPTISVYFTLLTVLTITVAAFVRDTSAAEKMQNSDELDTAHEELFRNYDRYYEVAKKHGNDRAKLGAVAQAVNESQKKIEKILEKNRSEFFQHLSTLEFQPDGSTRELPASELALIRESEKKKEPLKLSDLIDSKDEDRSEPEKPVTGPTPQLRGNGAAPNPSTSPTAESPEIEDQTGPRQFQFKGRSAPPEPSKKKSIPAAQRPAS